MFYVSSGQNSDNTSDNNINFTPGENIDSITSDLDLENVILSGKVIDILGNKQNTITLPVKTAIGTTFSLKNITKLPQILISTKDNIKNKKTTSKQTKINPNSIIKIKKVKNGWEILSEKKNTNETNDETNDETN